MLQSLRILQLALQFAILILILLAVQLHSWATIDIENIEETNATSVNQLIFAPDGYCFRYTNKVTTCKPFLHAILENSQLRDDWSAADSDPFSLPSVLLESDNVVNQALSCWCHTRGNLTWYMQGAQNVACLVVLETAEYTLALWGLFATVNLILLYMKFSSNFNALFSFISALFGILVALTWWFYSNMYIDRDYLNELALNWHQGTSYHCTLVAFVLAVINAQIAFDATNPDGILKKSRRFVRPTPRGENSNNWDPLSCPANYLV